MVERSWWLLLVLAAAVGCGPARNGGGSEDLATAPDLAGPNETADDLSTTAPTDLAGSSNGAADGGTAPDLTTLPCAPYPGDGVPVIASLPTLPYVGLPMFANNGTYTMVLWPEGINLGATTHIAWARLQNGAVVDYGEMPSTWFSSGPLFTLAGKFFMYANPVLYAFNDTTATWSTVSGWSANGFALSGNHALGYNIYAGPGFVGTSARVFDGTTLTASKLISNYNAAAIAPDGSGGFGVVTNSGGATPTLRIVTYDGTTLSAESTIATLPSGPYSLAAAWSGSQWCLGYTASSQITGIVGTPATSWTSTALAGIGGQTLVATGNPGSGTCALGGEYGSVAVYKASAWTPLKLASGASIFGIKRLLPFQTGYAFLTSESTTTAVGLYDGSTWTQKVITSTQDPLSTNPVMSVSATTLAVAWPEGNAAVPSVTTYESAAWTTPFALSSAKSHYPGIFVDGGDLVAAYPEAGVMKSRSRIGGTLGSAVVVPAPPTGGGINDRFFAVARRPDGHALIVWVQWNDDHLDLYGAEFDGATLGAPVFLAAGDPYEPPSVAANETTFVVSYVVGNKRYAAVWNGAGIGAPANLGTWMSTNTGALLLASTGTDFVAAWDEGPSFSSVGLVYVTSSNGTTWSAPQAIEPGSNKAIFGLAGGPGVVLEWSNGPSGQTARVFSGGAWSAASRAVTVGACHGASGNASALYVCGSASGTDAQLFASGAWADKPLGVGSQTFTVASDGTDYRLDFMPASPPMQSALLHAGAWSTPVADSSVNISAQTNAAAGNCGTWSLLYRDSGNATGNYSLSHVSGAAAYPTGATQSPSSRFYYRQVATWPGQTDALWSAPSPASNGAPVLYFAPSL